MKHYIEIKLRPDPEFSATTLMNALFNKLHKALFEMHATAIGVSFPEYDKTLGEILRLHSQTADLSQLQTKQWIGRMHDYCQASDILKAPTKVQYRVVRRQQSNKSNAKLERLLHRQEQGKRTKRPPLTEEGIASYIKQNQPKKVPFLTLQSSKGQRYRRYIVLGKLQPTATSGHFDQFGLSKIATVPWF